MYHAYKAKDMDTRGYLERFAAVTLPVVPGVSLVNRWLTDTMNNTPMGDTSDRRVQQMQHAAIKMLQKQREEQKN